MPVGAILTAKENASAAQPLLLATVTFPDATVLRLATHAVTWGGYAYLPRILNQETAITQALSEQGIDIPATVALRLADADYWLWNNYEKLKGFKGARIEMRAILYDVVANEYSSDSRVIFRGICREPGGRLPQHDGQTLSMSFVSRLALADVQLPPVRIQRTCPWVFPSTATQRQAAADDSTSEFWRCGYSPDATGGNARGSLIGGVPWTFCEYTKEACVTRGMYTQDSAARITGRFGGVQWMPKREEKVRNYTSGKRIDVESAGNEARYGDFVPMLWGQAWCDALVLNTVVDGNFLKCEVLVCLGELDGTFTGMRVVVNDTAIPHTFDDTELSGVPAGIPNATEGSKSGWWKCVNRGDRDGSPNADAGYGGLGDPYGSMAVLAVVVPHSVAAPGSVPRVRVYARRGTGNPATQLREILEQWCGLDSADLNTGSFTSAAALCDETISARDQFNNVVSQARFTSSLYLRQRENAAEVIRGLRNCMRGLLGPDDAGLLRLRLRRTLALQQPSAVSGSNVASPVSGGYPAYRFDESNILGLPAVSVITGGNSYSLGFQNARNQHSWDTFSPLDSEDIARSGGQQQPGSFVVKGADNYDQMQRLVATWMAEQLRGNPRGDTGGTVVIEFPVSMRGLHLSIGDICQFRWAPLGITSEQLVRVMKIQPATNFETVRVTVHWHSDAWYADTYGQYLQPRPAAGTRNTLERPAFAWQPYAEQPVSGDTLYDASEWTFRLSQRYELSADGSAIARLAVSGNLPVNEMGTTPPPFVPLQGSTAASGGSIAGGRTWYVAFSARDSAGRWSAISDVVSVYVPSGSANTITVNGLSWDAAATAWAVYAGADPNRLAGQSETAGTPPSSVTLTAIQTATWGAPDGEFDRLRVRVKRAFHSGLWGAQVVSVTSTTIRVAVAGAGFSTNQWAGYDVSLLGQADSEGPLPLATFRVASNSSDTLTLVAGNPVSAGITDNDVVVLRSRPTVGTDTDGMYLEDPGWQNCFATGGMTADEEIGRVIRFIAGTGKGTTAVVTKNTATKLWAAFPVTPDSTSRYVVEEGAWQSITETPSASNRSRTTPVAVEMDVNNYEGQTLLVQALTVDGGDTESVEALSPVRDIYLFGQSVPAMEEGYHDLVPVSGTATPDLADGIHHRITLSADVTVAAAVYTGGTLAAGQRLTVKIVQDATGRAVTWHADYVGLGTLEVDKTPNTYSILQFVRNPEDKWELQSASLGLS